MTEPQRLPSSRGRVPYRTLSLLVSAVLFAAGIRLLYRHLNSRELVTVWANLDLRLLAAAALVYWLQYPINSFRLHRVIMWATERASTDAPSLCFLFKLTCSSGFVAAVAPVGLASDAAKIAALRLFSSLSITDATRCALFDRVVGVQWISVIGLAMLPLQAIYGIDPTTILVQALLFGGLVAGVGVLLVLPALLGLMRYDLVAKLARVFANYRVMLFPQRSAVQLVIAILNVLSAWGTLYLLVRASGLSANILLVGGFVPLLQLVNSLPFLYMGWGGRELAMAATLGVAGGLTVTEAIAVSIAWGAVLIVTGAVNGVFLLGEWRVSRQAPTAARGPFAGDASSK